MNQQLFGEGGPHNIRRVGPDTYQMSVTIPVGPDRMNGRACPAPGCSPAYFRVRPGTGITESHAAAFCPYCHHSAEPSEFFTELQVAYAKEVLTHEATRAFERMVQEAFDIGPSGHKRYGGGPMPFAISYRPGHRTMPARPIEEELRRDLTCPHCRLEHAVFGLAMWCPDCGTDLFLEHVRKEFDVLRRILAAIPGRRAALGARAAAKDAENALEDTVSIFEAVLKILVGRHLVAQGGSKDEVHTVFVTTIRNTFQNVGTAAKTFQATCGVTLFDGLPNTQREELDQTFAMRHPITHNLGVMDRQYLERVRSGEFEGRELLVDAARVERAIAISLRVLERAYATLFPRGP